MEGCDGGAHGYGIQTIVSSEVKYVYVARLRFYAHETLQETADLKDAIQHTFTPGNFEKASIVDISEAEQR